MANYKIIFKDEKCPWEAGCPVLITAVQVSRNTETSEAYLQAKAKNISSQDVESIYATLDVKFSDGTSETLSFEYLDADIPTTKEIALKPQKFVRGDVEACKLTITRIKTAVDVWLSAGGADIVPAQKPLELCNRAAKERTRILQEKHGSLLFPETVYGAVQDHQSWWICACGQVNTNRDNCCKCGCSKASLLDTEDEAKLLASAEEYDETTYLEAKNSQEEGSADSLSKAINKFRELEDYKDAKERFSACEAKLNEITTTKKKRTKKIAILITSIVAVIVAAAISFIITMTQVVIPADNYNKAVALYGQEIKNAEVGDTFVFGVYEQDNNISNGREDIEWLVLAKEDNRILVISKYALDCKPYNTEYEDTAWEDCTLRRWLNTDFYNTAFNSGEQNLIAQTTVTAEKNTVASTNPGNDTTDSVFLLSISEAEKYFVTNEARMCAPTEYAIAQGAETFNEFQVNGESSCWWWLRTSGAARGWASRVSYIGSVNVNGDYVVSEGYTVRPAMWLSLEG